MKACITSFIFICLLLSATYSVSTKKSSSSHEHGLCRGCGREIIELYFLNEITSPFATNVRNSSLLTDSPVNVQTLKNPSGFEFSVVTVQSAGCKIIGEWHSKDTWFVNHSWSLCICPQCAAHLGWAFRRTDSHAKKAEFFALIEDKVLRESFVDSLLAVPQSYRNI